MALAESFGDNARWLWDLWSSQSQKFNAKDQEKVWKSFRRRRGRSLGTIFFLRSQYRGPALYSL
jgi:hypothetical protein